MKTVLFVCTGNNCRSPMAEAIFDDLVDDHPRLSGRYKAESAGTMACEGAEMAESACGALDELNVRYGRHKARQLTAELAEEADIILTMEAQHLDELEALCPDAQDKAHTLKGYVSHVDGFPGDEDYDIEDPFRQDDEVYLETAQELQACIKLLLERFAAEDTEV